MGKKLLVPDEFLLRYSILRLIAAYKKTLNIREARRRRWEKKYDEWWSKDSENASDYLWWQHSLADVPFRWKTGGVRERRVSALIADGMTRRIRWPHWSSGRPKVSRSDGNASLPIDIDGPVVVKGPQPADTRFCIPGRYQPEKGYICCRSLQVSRCQESNFDFFKRLECSVVSAFLFCVLHLEPRTIHTKFRELQRRAQRSNRRKKEEIVLRRRSLVMWKNSMHV